jgi:hypothetical protein
MRLSARDFGQFTSPAPIDLPIRRHLRWEFDDVPVKFANDDLLISYLWAAFSIGAPSIERFFVASLRPLIDSVADAKLARELDGMLTQEAMHAAAHAKFNRTLSEKGLPVDRAQAYVEDLVTRVGDHNYTSMDLVGMVAAGEHVMHSLARIYRSDPSIGAAMAPGARRLFEYHMLEEIEHISVSREAFLYFCGDDYVQRVKTGLITLVNIMDWFINTMTILLQEGPDTIAWRDWARFWRYGLVQPGVFPVMAFRIAEYFSPFYALRIDSEDKSPRVYDQDALRSLQPTYAAS